MAKKDKLMDYAGWALVIGVIGWLALISVPPQFYSAILGYGFNSGPASRAQNP